MILVLPETMSAGIRTGHGIVNFLTGIAESCDVFFYKIGGGYPGEVENGGLGYYAHSGVCQGAWIWQHPGH